MAVGQAPPLGAEGTRLSRLCIAAPMSKHEQAFSLLSEAEQLAVREKQRLAKARKRAAKRHAATTAAAAEGDAAPRAAEAAEHDPHRSRITLTEYFDACPHGRFYDPHLVASEPNVDLVMRLEADGTVIGHTGDGEPVTLATFNYFTFAGTDAQLWCPVLYAKLAYEGFFTITTSRRSRGPAAAEGYAQEPLPELQPFYGVVRQLRHYFGPSFTHSAALYHPARAVGCVLPRAQAYRMLIGAYDPMVCPNWGFRWSGAISTRLATSRRL